MEGWTLKKELASRGWSLTQACILCDMDRPTMEILVEGGQTLPQFALRVGERMHLTMEQTRSLGKPLKKEI